MLVNWTLKSQFWESNRLLLPHEAVLH